MKKVAILFYVLVISFCFCACVDKSSSVVRIHIRANSNLECDQSVKLLVRDSVIDYITPLIAECNNSDEVKKSLSNNLNEIEIVADKVLKDNGFCYVSTALIKNEYFPTRSYDGEVFPADYYDALILELGSGEGDNWWCVAYPPLCFVGEDVGSSNIKYKSKIVELINKYWS